MPAWLVDLLPALGLGVGAYVAIRADLAALRVIATNAATAAAAAHARIDRLMEPRVG